jgi:hypothetical protein
MDKFFTTETTKVTEKNLKILCGLFVLCGEILKRSDDGKNKLSIH